MGNQVSQPSAPAGVSPGDDRAHWRAEADRHAKERNSLYEKSQVLLASGTTNKQSLNCSIGETVRAQRLGGLVCLQEAYKAGCGAEAKQLSNQGKACPFFRLQYL